MNNYLTLKKMQATQSRTVSFTLPFSASMHKRSSSALRRMPFVVCVAKHSKERERERSNCLGARVMKNNHSKLWRRMTWWSWLKIESKKASRERVALQVDSWRPLASLISIRDSNFARDAMFVCRQTRREREMRMKCEEIINLKCLLACKLSCLRRETLESIDRVCLSLHSLPTRDMCVIFFSFVFAFTLESRVSIWWMSAVARTLFTRQWS